MKIILLVTLLSLVGCSVKERPAEQTQPTTSGASLPAGLFLSKGGKFLFHPSTTDLVPNDNNTVSYTITGIDLVPLDARQYQFDVKSDMPTMEMGGPWPAEELGTDDQGRLKATYMIWHGDKKHLWEFTIKILKDGNEVDTLVYSHLVKTE